MEIRTSTARTIFESEHDSFRVRVRDFVATEVVPHLERWEAAGHADREFFVAAGSAGLLGVAAPVDLGGQGLDDYRYNAIVTEELCAVGATSIAMAVAGFNDLVAPYLLEHGTPDQLTTWLPGLCSGEKLAAIAMTEPGTGSDLRSIRTQARRERESYVINGGKTLIGNGALADLILLVASTDPDPGRDGISLLLVDTSEEGFHQEAVLEKIGLRAQQVASFTLAELRVPRSALLGTEGQGLAYLRRNLAQERLCTAVMAMTSVERLLSLTLDHVTRREAFGQQIARFQHNTFRLAEMATEAEIGRAFVDRCIARQVDGSLTATEAAMAKWWVTELQQRVAHTCVQLHGGIGYLQDTAVTREFLDARASTIYAGTTEIMKQIIGNELLR